MKYLYIVRHAKSSRSDTILTDRDRPLNERGKHDVEIMATLLKKQKDFHLDLVMTSPAKRTQVTAKTIAKTVWYKTKHIVVEEALYGASEECALHEIQRCDDAVDHLMIVGHNPWLTNLINNLGYELVNLPTSGIVCFSSNESEWKFLEASLVQFQWFEYPKKYK